MENRNDIGKAFKDKLAHLDKRPNDDLWHSIEKDLDQKKKKRVFFWFFLGFLIVGMSTSLVVINQKQKSSSTDNNEMFEYPVKTSKSDSIVYPNANSRKDMLNSRTVDSLSNNQNAEVRTKSIISETSQTETKEKTINASGKKPSLRVNKDKKIQEPLKDQNNSNHTKTRKIETKRLVSETKKTIVFNDRYEEYEVIKKYKIVVKKIVKTNDKKAPIKKQSKNVLLKKHNTNRQNPQVKNRKNLVSKRRSSKSKPNQTIDAILEKQPEKTNSSFTNKDSLISNKNDTINNKKNVVLKLEKKLKPKRDYKKDSTNIDTKDNLEYYGSVFYGPTLFGSLSKHSFLNSSLDKNSKKHPIASCYGFYVKAKFKRLGYSLGYSKTNLKISNQFSQDQLITNFNNIELNATNSAKTINNYFNTYSNIELVQKISYYEMNLAFYYCLSKQESNFNIDAFTGISIMVLDENKLQLSSSENKAMEIGSAKNISKLNTSLNFGLAFQYKLYQDIYFDLNPIFKSYFSTFNEKNSSKPYSLSIQSGFTYKF